VQDQIRRGEAPLVPHGFVIELSFTVG
jgi:hypothetical protein